MIKDKNENVKAILAENMKKYVQIILKEYAKVIPEERQRFLRENDDYYSRIIIKDTGTISMFATNEGIVMPKGAYKIFKYFKLIPGYGINKKHQIYQGGQIFNTKTYYDYIKHVIISGMSVEDFFRDSLLHETMHFCGSGGGSAIREGFTELKTRELAQKYGLIASRCGYPKEVDIANRFQQVVGTDVANQITFAQNDKEIDKILQENCEDEIGKLFFEISSLMNKELNAKYNHSKFGGIFGPIKKARAYSQVNYLNVYETLEKYEKRKKTKFINDIKQEVSPVKIDINKIHEQQEIYKD